MNKFLICFISFLIFSVVVQAEDSDVVTLTDFTLNAALKQHSQIFVEFYAPWCGHCKQLAPEWETAATALKGVAVLAKIDAQENSEAAAQFQIQGFPTLKWFENGNPVDYNGPRDAQSLISWVNKRINPIRVISEPAEVEELRAQVEVVVLANIASSSANWDTLKSYALSTDDIAFVAVSGAAAADIPSETFLIASQHKEPFAFSGSIEELPKFVQKNAYPLLQRITTNGQAVFTRLFSSGLPFSLIFLNDDADLADYLAQLQIVAAKYEDRFLVAWLSAQEWGQVLPRLGASGSYVPTAIAWEVSTEENPKRPLAYDEDSVFSVSALDAWFQAILDGTAQSWRQSQPIPEQQEGSVRTIVWKTFEAEVLHSGKTVFLEFFSPGCGHCKNLAPAWQSLGDAFADHPDVVIAAYDATANYVPDHFNIQGFPTLKLFKPNQAPIDYEGGRDVASLKDFVNQHL